MDERTLHETIDYLESYTGLRSPSSNQAHFRRVMTRHAEAAGLAPARLASDIRSDGEARQRLINEVMIGETYFFREASHFRLLRDSVLSRLHRPGRRLECWSASCSTGEEAVSLAALLDGHFGGAGGTSYAIHASDINDAALGRLRDGVYPRSALRRDGEEFHETLLRPHLIREDERSIAIDPRLLSRISIHHLNFYLDPLDAIPDGLDLVFFRNTLLYASEEKRGEIVERIAAKLRIGGVLFLATSELPFVRHRELRLDEVGHAYFFVRVGPAPAEAPRAAHPARAAAPPDSSSDASAPPSADGVLSALNYGDEAPAPSRNETEAGIAALIRRFYAATNRGQREEAARALEEFESLDPGGAAALLRYCRGRHLLSAGDPVGSAAEFEAALEVDPAFWPALFEHAALEAPRSARRAAREFRRCASLIELEPEAERERFAFLLEGFNSAYFRHMCVRWIERLDARGGRPCP